MNDTQQFEPLTSEQVAVLAERIGPTVIADEWHVHPKGGGFIRNKAQVSADVYVGPRVVVYAGTIRGGTIRGGTIWGGTIRGGTIEGGTIEGGTIRGGTIRGGTIWGGTIEGGTIWGGTIRGGTIRGGTIWGGTWDRQPLCLMGSIYPVTNSAPGKVTVGCQTHDFEWWRENGVRLGEREDWTAEQITEYTALIEFCIEHGVGAEENEVEA